MTTLHPKVQKIFEILEKNKQNSKPIVGKTITGKPPTEVEVLNKSKNKHPSDTHNSSLNL